MPSNTLKTIFYLLVMLLTIYPIIDLIRKKYKWYITLPLIALTLGFIWLAFKVKNIEEAEKRAAELKAESLTERLTKSNNSLIKKTDSTNQFMNELRKQFNITDSANIPVRNQTIANHINRVDYLKQF